MSKLKNRFPLILILVLCVTPPIVAVIWYLNIDRWRPTDFTNHGQFVTPVRQISYSSLPLMSGKTLPENWFQHIWTLVYAGPPNCPVQCKKALYFTRQIRLALGARMNKVQRLFIVTGHVKKPVALRRAHPDLTIVEATGIAGKQFLAQFTQAAGTFGQNYWLVDPNGRLMMVYHVGKETATGTLSDLRHLMKYSRVR